MSTSRSVLVIACVLIGAGGCSADQARPSVPGSQSEPTEEEHPEAAPGQTRADTAASDARVPGQPVLLITEPAQLARLPHVHDFGALVFGHPSTTTRELCESSEYRAFVRDLELPEELPGRDHFPGWWLNHHKTSLSLVAVVNRIDRRDFSTSGCGETRLIYRLGYAESDAVQRLPVGLNLVFEQPDDSHGCTEVARRWMVAEGGDPIAVLTREGGPLAPAALSREHLLALESNIRVMEDANSAADNELRVFAWDREEQRLRPTTLEWQPRYKTMSIHDIVYALLTPEGLADIERGAGLPPAEFVHERWAKVRLRAGFDNGPFTGMWWPQDISLPSSGLTSTASGVQHRLNGMSCSGCHGSRSVAGFHLPGAGGSEQLLGGASAHLLAELPWRARYVEALAHGEEPDRTRKLHNDGPPGFGHHCSLATSPIDSLACDAGFACVATQTGEFGVCLPEAYEGPGPCERDGPSCWAPSRWFPDGFARRPCVEGQPCAPIPVSTDYAACRQADDPWACAHQRADPTRVDGCTLSSDCRDGYVCVAAADGTGVCLPTASLAEFRLIGHATRLR